MEERDLDKTLQAEPMKPVREPEPEAEKPQKTGAPAAAEPEKEAAKAAAAAGDASRASTDEAIPELKINRGKKKRFRLDLVSIITGLIVFALLTSLLVYIRREPEEVIEAVGGAAATIITGGDTTKTLTPIDKNEVLKDNLKPFVYDEDSPLYEAFNNAFRVNVLLMGINGNMTDTIMLGSYDMENQTVDIISVPRDTYYYRKGYTNYGFYKINSIYRTDGAVAAASAVSEVLYGMPIHYYVVIDYNAIREVMKVLGGVEYNVPFAMRYVDNTPGENLNINIPAGLQTIDESNVIEFLRFRHTNPAFAAQGYKSYNDGDIGRIKVQQQFVVAAMKKMISSMKYGQVIRAVLDNTVTDLDYDISVKVMAKAIAGLDMDNINTYMLPGTDRMIEELSFWVHDEAQTLDMLKQIYNVSEEAADEEAEETDSAA